MKGVEWIVGLVVILCFVIGLVTFTLGNLTNEQETNSSIYNTTTSASTFFDTFSGMTGVIVVIGIVAILLVVVVMLKTLVPKGRF